jgi:hypothetical protein
MSMVLLFLSEQRPAQAGNELDIFNQTTVTDFVPLGNFGHIDQSGTGLHLSFITIHRKVSVFVAVTVKLDPFGDRQYILCGWGAKVGQHPNGGISVFVLNQRAAIQQNRITI